MFKNNKIKLKLPFKKLSKVTVLLFVIVFIFLILLISIFKNKFSNSNSITQQSVLVQLKEEINLPDNDPNSFMRISDASSLSSQDIFYKDAKNGEYIIVYDSLALVYDFDDKKIINIRTKN